MHFCVADLFFQVARRPAEFTKVQKGVVPVLSALFQLKCPVYVVGLRLNEHTVVTVLARSWKIQVIQIPESQRRM